MSPRALVVDDDAGMRFMLRDALATAGLTVDEAPDGLAALERIAAGGYHLVITDLRMPRLDGLGLLRRLRETPGAPRVVLITAHGSEQHVVEALRLGVFDYLRKPCAIADVMAVVARATEDVRLRLENERLAGELALSQAVVLRSPAMTELAVLVARAARRDVTVLVTGESGTGKERIAEAIVGGSRRAGQPFVRFNCAALTPDLAEAELFGHSKGAFTGAQRARPGLFREAHLGTLLLDEIGELHPALQAKLLRVLQEGEVRPVGEERSVKVDVRVIASTHRDLGAMVMAGAFRQDLFYRLNVVRLHVPPLRERPEDIRTLAEQFCERFSRQFDVGPLHPSPELFAVLAARPWPGNVRELENTIERMVALSDGETLDLKLIDGDAAPSHPSAAGLADGEAAPSALGLRVQVEAFERRLLVQAMAEARGNQAEAARLLRIGRATMHDKLRKHGLND